MQRPTTQALTDAEFDRLTDSLCSIGGPAMNLEEVDGFFAALICCPDMVMPSEYLPAVWGEDSAFVDTPQAKNLMELLLRHWNTIAGELHRTLEVRDVYLPIFLQADDGIAHGNDWAKGFMRAIALRPTAWMALMDDQNESGALLPMMMLAHEHDPDPAMRPKPISPERREDLLEKMVAGLTRIYRYFEPHRRSWAEAHDDRVEPIRRPGPKVGRNDPCPCGSGRKYKNCCGSGATVH